LAFDPAVESTADTPYAGAMIPICFGFGGSPPGLSNFGFPLTLFVLTFAFSLQPLAFHASPLRLT
jgi:hypothetical protein